MMARAACRVEREELEERGRMHGAKYCLERPKALPRIHFKLSHLVLVQRPTDWDG
jgi:hypothetical protein